MEISSVSEQTVSQKQPFQHLSQQQKSNTLRYGHTETAGALEGSVAVQIKDQLRRWDKLRVEPCYAPVRQCWSHREPFDTDGTSRGTSPGTGGGVNSGEMAQQTSTSSAEPSQHEDVSSDAGALVKVRQGVHL